MSRPDGGQAFPYAHPDDGGTRWHGGMTMRDYFAAKALEGQLAALALQANVDAVIGNAAEAGITAKEQVARAAYEYADAMLAERSKP